MAEPAECGYILAGNLETALFLAIEAAKATDEIAGRNYATEYKSAFRAGLEENLAYLRKHGHLEVRS